MMHPPILRQAEGHKGSFYIEKDGRRLAEMTYTMAGDTTMIIDHTEVSDELRGSGAGLDLVRMGVEHAREKGLKVIPLCPFAKAMIQRHAEFQDVLK